MPLVMLIGFQSAWAAFACRMDGEVRDVCCCPPKKAKQKPSSEDTQLQAQGCCDVTIHTRDEATPGREPSRFELAAFEIVAPVATPLRPQERVERSPSVHTFARPPPRIALYLDKHALLR